MGAKHDSRTDTADHSSGAKSAGSGAEAEHPGAAKATGLGPFMKMFGMDAGHAGKTAGKSSKDGAGSFHLGGDMFAALGYGGSLGAGPGIASVDHNGQSDATHNSDAKHASDSMHQTQLEDQKAAMERGKLIKDATSNGGNVDVNRVKTSAKQTRAVTDFIKG